MAAGLVGLGIEPGSAICLFSHTRYEFTILDYAILAAGCVTVPIYETDSADQVKWAATNSGAVAIVVENATLERNVDAVAADLPAVRPHPAHRRRRPRHAPGRGQGRRSVRGREAVEGHHPRPAGVDRLHLGHDRLAQGLRAHPRQLRQRGGRRRRPDGGAPQRAGHHAHVPARSPTSWLASCSSPA